MHTLSFPIRPGPLRLGVRRPIDLLAPVARRRSADFYDEGLLVRLEADAVIRQKKAIASVPSMISASCFSTDPVARPR